MKRLTVINRSIVLLAILLGMPVTGEGAIAFRAAASRDLNGSAGSIVISKPTGTVQGDVMVAMIAVRPETVTITAPDGFTRVVRQETVAGGNSTGLALYWKVASASEPASYTFSLSANSGSAGGIMSFSGVDNATPIDVSASVSTPNGLSHNAPSVTTTVTNTMIITAHEFGASERWTGPAGMTEVIDVAADTPPVTSGVSIVGNYALRAAAGPTGTWTATANSKPTAGATATLALRPVVCAAVADPGYVSATARSGQVTVSWSSANPVTVLRKTSAFGSERPADGVTYAASDAIGAATVAYTGSAASFTSTGLVNGTAYHYKVFPRNTTPCYAGGTVVKTAPAAGPAPAWSYTMAGGSMLNAGIAGEGTVYTSSNAGRIVSLNTADGTQSWAPLTTSAAVQGTLTWLPTAAGGVSVVGGDQGGRVYSVNAALGVQQWVTLLSGVDAIQAAMAAQLRPYANAAFQAAYAGDVLFAVSRNASTTNNKVYALRASDGAVLWTFNGTGAYAMDYLVGMPYVDYERNRLYVASRAGAAGTQASLWIINTLDGSLVQSFALGHLESSPSMSADGATLYVGNQAGDLHAVDLTGVVLKWAGPAVLGSALKGFVWEDWTVRGRLYFSTANGNVWALQDPGPGPPPNGSAPAWKQPVAGVSTPLLLDRLYVGSSDGRLHQLNPGTGTNEKQFVVGDGTAAVGDVSTEDAAQLLVGTTAGTLYKIPLPLP